MLHCVLLLCSLIYTVVSKGDAAITELLLRHGAAVDAVDESGTFLNRHVRFQLRIQEHQHCMYLSFDSTVYAPMR